MMASPRILSVDPHDPDPRVIREVVQVVQAEGLVALPTDTLYGLGADIFSGAAVQRILMLKARPHDKPIPIFISSIAALEEIARGVPEAAKRLAQQFWPGPLTLILHASPEIPENITAGTGTVGVRIPNLPLIQAILAPLKRPLTGTSANRSGGINPVIAADVLKALGTQLDLLVDGGKTSGGVASTVLDCTQFPFRVIRDGAIERGAIAALLGENHPISL
ncbi:MAG: L-threonylcarbamoyladenylate synthase [Candidatus Methylomirabilales bacterium]